MPLFARAVMAYAAGLLCGFASLHVVTACGAIGLCVCTVVQRQREWIALAALLVAGHAVATEQRWRDAHCRDEIVAARTAQVVLESDAALGAFARATSDQPGCAIRMRLAVREGSAPYGAGARVTGTFYASGDGVLVKPAVVTVERAPGVLARMRTRAARALERDFQQDAPLAKALLIADMADLGPDVRDRFATAGLVHILSISGLHVTIVASALLLLLEAARIPRRHALVLGCMLTALYVSLIGAPAPAVRAAVMFGGLAMSRLMQRPVSPWGLLALGAAWPLVGDPRIVLDIGWQLTVAGMTALIVAGDINRRIVDRRCAAMQFGSARAANLARRCANEMTTGIVATVVTAPFVAWYFGRLALVAPLANIAANPVANVLQPTLFLSLALEWWPAASGLVADAARPGLRALDGVATLAAASPGASVRVAPTLMGSLLAALAILAVASAVRRTRPWPSLACALATLGVIAWIPVAPRGSGELELHAIDVGQADAIALRTPHGRWILVDAGGAWTGGNAGRRTVIPYIKRYGGDVALFVLTHPHLDHVGGASDVLASLRPAAYWDGAFLSANDAYRASLATAQRLGIAWHRARPGDSLRVDGVVVRVLAPDSAWTMAQSDPNNASTVLMVEYGSVRLLLTGDAEAPEESWMASRWGDTALRADVLKSGHHGSRTSSTAAFLDAVRPRVAVVSVGAGNTYGLPSPSVMDAYAARGIVTLRTDQLGPVVVATDGRRIRVAGSDGVWLSPP